VPINSVHAGQNSPQTAASFLSGWESFGGVIISPEVLVEKAGHYDAYTLPEKFPSQHYHTKPAANTSFKMGLRLKEFTFFLSRFIQ
jgi:hypothetical protein